MGNNTETTKNFWSDSFGSKLYRKFARKRFFRMHQEIASLVLSRKPQDLLDIACGPGDFLRHLSSAAPEVHLFGTDIAPGMVECATQKLAGKASIQEAPGGKQPFPERSFDVVTIMMAFHHFPGKLDTLTNIKKLLRPAGVLIIADIVAKSRFQKQLWNIVEKIISVRGYVAHYTEAEIRELSGQSGFSFSISHIPGMPKRYRLMSFENN